MVACAIVSTALSEGGPRRIPHACAVGQDGDCRCGDGASGPRPVVDTQGQPRTGRSCLTLSARRRTFLASPLHHPQPSGASGPAYPSLRTMGKRASEGRVLAAGSGQRAGDQRTHIAAPLPNGTGEVATGLLPGPACRTRTISCPGQRPRPRSHRRRGGLCRRSHATNAPAPTPGPWSTRASCRPALMTASSRCTRSPRHSKLSVEIRRLRSSTCQRAILCTLKRGEIMGTVQLHRVIRTPPERLYKAFTDPDAMAKWLPPHGFTCKVHHMDVKVGGGFKMSFTNFTTGKSHSFGGTYLELEPGQRLRYTDVFDDPNLPGEMITTVTLTKVFCGTDLKVVQEGIPDVIPVEACYLGWQESLTLLTQLAEPEIPD